MRESSLDPATSDQLAKQLMERQAYLARDFAALREKQFKVLRDRMGRKKNERANRIRQRQQKQRQQVGRVMVL